jgi:hypothetical protein
MNRRATGAARTETRVAAQHIANIAPVQERKYYQGIRKITPQYEASAASA